ncbi:LAFA_0E04852g1_1 [Lachancea sp. 'fantastica']|nr:LAFA_0E04852g1_1 [Lachancea sp. 'fantastica']
MNENTIERQIRGSPTKNVFKRLSTSPNKKLPTNTNRKNSTRLSPERVQHTWERPVGYEATPKRLQSPPYLRDFKPPAGTLSVDRVHFKNDPEDNSIQLSFPTSPIRTTYSNSTAPGGDGSMSRIRTRFGGGLRSPGKMPTATINALTTSVNSARNLLPELQEQDEAGLESKNRSPGNNIISKHRSNIPTSSANDGFKIRKPRYLIPKKSVKFESDLADNAVQEQLSKIVSMLTEIIERQDRLEAKVSSMDRARKS